LEKHTTDGRRPAVLFFHNWLRGFSVARPAARLAATARTAATAAASSAAQQTDQEEEEEEDM